MRSSWSVFQKTKIFKIFRTDLFFLVVIVVEASEHLFATAGMEISMEGRTRTK